LTSDSIRSPLALSALVLALGLAPVTLPSCAEDSAGIEVPVAYRGETLTGEALDTADAQPVRLTRARVALHSIELRACPESTLAQAAGLFAPSVARAHSSTSPTRIGVPAILNALSEDALHPGTFRPVPGEYCGLRGMLATPDEDALGADPASPLHAAAELHGERLGPDGEVLSSFALSSTMSVAFEWTFDEPLVLDAATPYAEAWIVVDAEAWIAATVVPEGELDAEGASALSEAAADALRVELVRPQRSSR
jgi:hypothetical protein